MDANTIHARLGPDGWRRVLLAAGLSERQLSKKNGPCPGCGGTDRYHFSNYKGRGDSYCRNCGHSDGFRLLMAFKGCEFPDARKLVLELMGVEDPKTPNRVERIHPPVVETVAKPTGRVVAILRESCGIEDCDPAMNYLRSRGLWPLPEGHRLKAHPSVAYWHEREQIGRYPALVAPVRDNQGELVTLHVTYLEPSGESKLRSHEPRKLLSSMAGRAGCAVPLSSPDGGMLGIAEGIETALSAAILHRVPVWAVLNTALMAKFVPPSHVTALAIFADSDKPGYKAACELMQRLQGKVRLAIQSPEDGDWNDYLMRKLAVA